MAKPKSRIEYLRKINFLSQREVAEKLEMSQQHYYKIESGKARLSLAIAKQLKEVFNLATIDELLEEAV